MKERKLGFTVDSILDKGLRSKVFWAVFFASSSKYQVSKFIYGVGDSRSGTIGEYIIEFEKLGYLERKKDRYFVKTEKLEEEIEQFLPNEVSLDQEQKEILIDLLDSLIFRQSFITMTFKFVHKGNTKNGGFLANLFTMMSTLSMNVIDESRLEGKSDLKKELRELNKIINEDKQPKKHYTISDLFRKKMRELEIQSDKESNDYFSNKKKLKANKIQGNITPDTSVFYIDYLTKLFSLIPLELLNKLKFLNYDAAVHLSHLTDRGRQFYVPMDNKYERFYLYRKNQSS